MKRQYDRYWDIQISSLFYSSGAYFSCELLTRKNLRISPSAVGEDFVVRCEFIALTISTASPPSDRTYSSPPSNPIDLAFGGGKKNRLKKNSQNTHIESELHETIDLAD
jgi:hypothetical protein